MNHLTAPTRPSSHYLSDPAKRNLIAAASSLDMIAVVSAFYYWLLVRPGIPGRSSLAAIALMGALHACFLYPNAKALTGGVAGLCEAGLIGFVVVQVRRVSRRRSDAGDPVASMEHVLEASLLSPVVARLLAAEIGIFLHAIVLVRQTALARRC